MRCALLFLVLSMVVLMAQPGECIYGLIFKGLYHGIVKRRRHGGVEVTCFESLKPNLSKSLVNIF
uniref:Uncharacterized protein n=1 Tax=Salarias fasciatus TaxID=181472 RepID=A0A672F5H6_SALFA